MDQINPIRLYKVPEVANLLSISEGRVRDLIASGQLRAKQIRDNSHPLIVGQSILDFVSDPTPAAAAVNE